jgi:hypothetical protein
MCCRPWANNEQEDEDEKENGGFEASVEVAQTMSLIRKQRLTLKMGENEADFAFDCGGK